MLLRKIAALLLALSMICQLVVFGNEDSLDYFYDNGSDFSRIYQRSENITVDSTNAVYVNNDSGRFARNTTQNDEWIAYKTQDNKFLSITSYYHSSEAIANLKLMGSRDHKIYNEIKLDLVNNIKLVEHKETGTFWQKVTFNSAEIPSGIKYVKIIFPYSTANVWNGQIGEVVMTKSREILGKIDSYNKTTPPKAPTNIVAMPSDKRVAFSYNEPYEVDLKGINIYKDGKFLKLLTPGRGVTSIRELEYDKKYKIEFESVDIYGNKSAKESLVVSPDKSLEAPLLTGKTYLYPTDIQNSRNRRIVEVTEGEILHRGVFEWVGTHFSDREWEGTKEAIDKLHKEGKIVIGGISAWYWEPKYESGEVTKDKNAVDLISMSVPPFTHIKIDRKEILDHFIYKAKKQIDAGMDGIDFDEFGIALKDDYEYVNDSLDYVSYNLKKYAKDKYDKPIYIATNSRVGGQDIFAPEGFIKDDRNDGSESIDLFARNIPYKFYGTENLEDWTASYDGSYNFIDDMRKAHKNVYPKKFHYFRDYGSTELYRSPHKKEDLPYWYRISAAQIIAAGGIPGNIFGYYNTTDPIDSGTLPYITTINKFLAENRDLWVDAKFSDIKAVSSNKKVYTSAFDSDDRFIVHMVNGDYNVDTQSTNKINKVEIRVPINKTVKKVCMTTPDLPPDKRLSELDFTYNNGNICVNIPYLDVHNIISFEYSEPVAKTYKNAEIIFPFPNPENLYVGNHYKFNPIITDGYEDKFLAYVNGIEGGNSQIGTIDQEGNYVAPKTPQRVKITFQSKISSKAIANVDLNIASSTEVINVDFNNKDKNNLPTFMRLVDGRGDFEVVDNALVNKNLSEGFGNGDLLETALYPPFIIGGDSTKQNSDIAFDFEYLSDPVAYYGVNSGTGFSIAFGVLNDKNYYEYILTHDGRLTLIKTENGVRYPVGAVSKYEVFKTNEKYNIELKTFNENTRLYVNGEEIRRDNHLSLFGGAMGFKTSYTQCAFRNLSIRPGAVIENLSTENIGVVKGNILMSDECSDLSKVISSNNITIDTANPQYLAGDKGRFTRTTNQEGKISYDVKGNSYLEIEYFNDVAQPPCPITVYLCNNNTKVIAKSNVAKISEYGGWAQNKLTISIDENDVTSVEIVIPAYGGVTWSPEIGSVKSIEKTNVNFKDIAGNPFESDIKKLVDYGVLKGDEDGNFNPNSIITGYEFSIMINRFIGKDGYFTTNNPYELSIDEMVSEAVRAFDLVGNTKGLKEKLYNVAENQGPTRACGVAMVHCMINQVLDK